MPHIPNLFAPAGTIVDYIPNEGEPARGSNWKREFTKGPSQDEVFANVAKYGPYDPGVQEAPRTAKAEAAAVTAPVPSALTAAGRRIAALEADLAEVVKAKDVSAHVRGQRARRIREQIKALSA